MRRFLVVANQTLAGEHLADVVRDALTAGPCEFFVLVPASHANHHAVWTEGVAGGGDTGAGDRLERGELNRAEFAQHFEAECAAAGGSVSASGLMAAIHTGSGPRPAMLRAIKAIGGHGLHAGAITNNWAVE